MSGKPYPTELSLCEGKYTVLFDLEEGRSECLRYGEPWRELHGDKLILAMFDRIVELEEQKSDIMKDVHKFRRRILAAAAGIDNGDPPNRPCKEKP